jgi:nucleoside phosphorylase/CheY-like chemotaxis protein
MIKILLVDDSQEKIQKVTSCILENSSVSLDHIDTAGDVYNAKKMILSKKYDLLILDLNIPSRVDKPVERGRGIDVLNFVRGRETPNVPKHIVGLTAYEDVLQDADFDFRNLLWRVIKFSNKGVQWRNAIRSIVDYLASNDLPPFAHDGATYHYDFGIVCALEEELQAVLALDLSWQEIRVPYDFAQYHRGSLVIGGKEISVVAVSAPNMGMPIVACTANKLISTFVPKFLLMVGICAGVKSKTKIGDVLIADPCFDWGSGKWIFDEKLKRLRFMPAPYQLRVASGLKKVARAVATDANVLPVIYAQYNKKKPANVPTCIVSAMASGGSVIQAESLMDEVRDQHKNLIGIEMESYAVYCAAEYAIEPKPAYISMKSVCDHGSAKKNDKYHSYACYVSAQFALEFMKRLYVN